MSAQAPPDSSRQAEHYDRILADYDKHYFDKHSMAYRRRFILDPMLKGADLSGLRVADLASGSGETSMQFKERFPGVEMHGFDISSSACESYRAKTGCPADVLDLTKGYSGAADFDAAVIIGGLHHCVVDLPGTLRTVAQMLKPGGHFFFFEPNKEYVLQAVRNIWYRADKYFDAETEEALVHSELVRLAGGAFRPVNVSYAGGPAFFLVLNSLIFRIPAGVKNVISPPLMLAERAYNVIPTRFAHAFFVAHWVKT